MPVTTKFPFFLAVGLLSSILLPAQHGSTLTLDECYQLARQNYPLVKQNGLIRKSKQFTLENISKGYLPQFSINGQATYQSDVTEVPSKIPNNEISPISKDQYKLYAEINQSVFDGGVKRLQKQETAATAEMETQKLEVELYKLYERVNELYFGILLTREQIKQTEILKSDIKLGLARTKAAIDNGTALKSSAYTLEAELLKADQRNIELISLELAYKEMLGLFLNKTLDEHIILERPARPSLSMEINRPELSLYNAEKKSLDIQSEMVSAKNRPTAGLFLQAGYGRPGLNMLKNDFSAYYQGGVRVTWSLSGLYTTKKEKALVETRTKSVDLQKETFVFNTRLTQKKQNAEISKLEDLVKSDNEIIELRNKIKNTALAQLEFGVMNSNDYLREVNAYDQARQTQLLHEMQLLRAQHDLQTTSGNTTKL